ncbi:hypothetical protein CDAR_396101 [Caerostris darwini]|uniref:Uncharacterized protein n=1 Tax=Caerostris darwini TaxID=1538125 RepID=A0AAV4WQU6_9ARAC|nr:hypothetical protein CDAR_396101 [Caerostris darwini]
MTGWILMERSSSPLQKVSVLFWIQTRALATEGGDHLSPSPKLCTKKESTRGSTGDVPAVPLQQLNGLARSETSGTAPHPPFSHGGGKGPPATKGCTPNARRITCFQDLPLKVFG